MRSVPYGRIRPFDPYSLVMKRAALRTAVFYYSRRGGTRMIAEAVAAATGAELRPVEAIKEPPAGGPAGPAPACDLAFLGTPARLGWMPPAVRRFCARAGRPGAVALFCTGRFGRGRLFRRLKAALPGTRCLAEAAFRSPLVGDERAELARARAWARQVVRDAAVDTE